MKILTGKFRGKTIRFKANPYLRPTADKARKAIFDMLQGGLDGKRVLDLFSGTGALGLEALSNGAAFVTFVEKNKNQAATIEKNLVALGLEIKGQVLVSDALEMISSLYEKREVYDIIFLDPPYQQRLGAKAMEVLTRLPIWNKQTIIFLECHEKEPAPHCRGEVSSPGRGNRAPTLIKSRTYGDTKILVYSFSSN